MFLMFWEDFDWSLTLSRTSINRRLLFLTITSIASPRGACHWNTTLTLSSNDCLYTTAHICKVTLRLKSFPKHSSIPLTFCGRKLGKKFKICLQAGFASLATNSIIRGLFQRENFPSISSPLFKVLLSLW